jgi:hypothetical protein
VFSIRAPNIPVFYIGIQIVFQGMPDFCPGTGVIRLLSEVLPVSCAVNG